jgi:hypothetical protein
MWSSGGIRRHYKPYEISKLGPPMVSRALAIVYVRCMGSL